jgi:hypothetical protein
MFSSLPGLPKYEAARGRSQDFGHGFSRIDADIGSGAIVVMKALRFYPATDRGVRKVNTPAPEA